MARCSTKTGLPLDTWAAILGISPWEFNQMSFPVPKSAQCKDSIYQFPWQRDHLGREEIGEAIASAEKMLADELLYWPYPRHFVGEVQQYTRPHQRELFGFAGDPRGNWKTVPLDWKKIIKGGVFNRVAVGSTIPAGDITKLDLDGDGIFESFSATLNDSAIADITDPYELGLYFTDNFRHGEQISETWRVRPLTITISGTIATFTGHRTLLVNPQKEFAVAATPLDPADDTNYVNELDCYRVFTDDTATAAQPYQGVAEWKTVPGCTTNCTFEVAPLCLGEHNNDQGRVFASFGEVSAWPFRDREPDRVSVNYCAGLALQGGTIEPEMAKIITYLSVSLLANEKCGCDRANRILDKWRKPITKFTDNNGAGAEAYTINNTNFPMTAGGEYAWQRVRRMKDIEVVSL
ncbi:MAG TPA: hypothetical protein VLK33_08745 [Terriglobales bacterium]|nr:hypothetical protein [Terriglobales bacterium]